MASNMLSFSIIACLHSFLQKSVTSTSLLMDHKSAGYERWSAMITHQIAVCHVYWLFKNLGLYNCLILVQQTA